MEQRSDFDLDWYMCGQVDGFMDRWVGYIDDWLSGWVNGWIWWGIDWWVDGGNMSELAGWLVG